MNIKPIIKRHLSCRVARTNSFMVENYFKAAWRSLSKNRTFTTLNVTGLSIGLACSLLIALYVVDELSYDRFNAHADQIYRIGEQVRFGDFNYNGAEVPGILAPVLARDFSQIEQYTRFKINSDVVIRKGNENIREDKVVYADSSLFQVFSFDMIAGNKATALKEPHSLVITESAARRYFTETDVIGKTLTIIGSGDYKITGVVKDLPTQSHFNFDLFLPLGELESSRNDSWITYNFQTYLVLKPGTNVRQFEKQLNRAAEQYTAPELKSKVNTSEADFKKAGNYIRYSLMPLTDIHLYSDVSDELGTNGSIQYVYIFSSVSIFILLIACINFMNLSTARSANRAKEVGVRKVLGGGRKTLIAQFLTESLVTCFLSFAIAIAIVTLLLPLFNQLADKQINVSILSRPAILLAISGLLILVSLISGSYPAFFLSSFQPIKVLKGNLSMGFKGSALRNTLVVLQFTISVILMIGTLVIYYQLRYIRNKDLGFNKDQVLLLQNTTALNDNTTAFANELLHMPGVKNVTRSGFLPVTGDRTSQGFITEPHFDGKNFTLMQAWPVDERYLPTFQIQLKSGRNFSAQYRTDSAAVIINETAAKIYGGVDPVNKKIYMLTDLKGTLAPYNIIGVIKDFNFNSLREQVAPMVLSLRQDNGGMALRIAGRDIPGLLGEIKAKWKAMAPSQPFSYTFLDDEFNKQYGADQRRGEIFLVFSILAILIACLGLFGLVTFAAEQRVKEIGIRKVLGAAIPDIFAMLSKDFIKMLALSICIASPIAWWAMTKWLQDFAYRISISWWMFGAVGALSLLIAIVTLSFQVAKAALANPVKSLRAE
jgi:putative ABC transport system permease protein